MIIINLTSENNNGHLVKEDANRAVQKRKRGSSP